MDRGRVKTGVLRVAASENQMGTAVPIKSKRVQKQFAAVDQNVSDKRVAVKSSVQASAKPAAKKRGRLAIIPKVRSQTVIDIDGEKSANYLNCPDLAPSQYEYLFEVESLFLVSPGYLSSTSINAVQRQRVIDWMTLLHAKFCDTQETLFIAVNYFDRYLAKKPEIKEEQLQLIAAAALYTAAKFEEIYPIAIDDICCVTEGIDGAELSPVALRKTELEMLKFINFKLNPPLKNHFLRRCSMGAGATVQLHVLSKFLIEASLYDPDLSTALKPSLVAATASYISLTLFGERTKLWDETMEHYSRYLEPEIVAVVPRLAAVVRQLCAPGSTFHIGKKWAGIVSNSTFCKWLNSA